MFVFIFWPLFLIWQQDDCTYGGTFVLPTTFYSEAIVSLREIPCFNNERVKMDLKLEVECRRCGLRWAGRRQYVVSDDNLSSCVQDMARLCVTNRTVQGVKKLSCRPRGRLPLILKLITYNSIVLLVGITAVFCLAYWSVRQSTWSLCLLQISVDHVQFLCHHALGFSTSRLKVQTVW
jgi:hypothetical protein